MIKRITFSIIVLSVLISCGTEDRHPDVPLLDIDLSEDMTFEELDVYIEFITDTDDFVYVKNKINDHMIVRDKKTHEIIYESYIDGEFIIDEKGTIYYHIGVGVYEEDKEEMYYKLEAPYYQKQQLEIIDTRELGTYRIGEMYEKEIAAVNAIYDKEKEDNSEYYRVVDSMKYRHLENNFLFNYKNILQERGRYISVIRYNDGKEYAVKEAKYFLHYEKYKGFNKKYDPLNVVGENESRSEKSKFFNKKFTLKEFDDSANTSYHVGGGNHFAPGLNITTLYYYELKTKLKTIRFKSNEKIEEAINFEGDMLVVMNEKTYKIMLK